MKDAEHQQQIEILLKENTDLKQQLDDRVRELTEIVRDEIEYRALIQDLRKENEKLQSTFGSLKELLALHEVS